MEERLPLYEKGVSTGILLRREEGLHTAFSAECSQGQGMRKLWLCGETGERLLLGTLLGAVATDEERANLAAGKPVLVGFDRKVRVGPQFVEGLKATDLRQVPFFDYADDILIVHGTADDVVPMQDSAQFADDNVIEFVPIEGADHRFRDPKKMDAAIALIIGFFGL